MEKLPTTVEELAAMIDIHMANKEVVQALDMKVQALDKKVTEGFDQIKHLLLGEQKREIEDLKQRMNRLEDALAV
jgi:hypothetical protein